MTNKEWIKEQLSYTDDHWTTTDRIMLTKILKDLERLEMLEKHYDKLNEDMKILKDDDRKLYLKFKELEQQNEKLKKAIEWLKNTFEITIDSKVRISDGIDCIQAFPIDMKTNEVLYNLLKEVLGE